MESIKAGRAVAQEPSKREEEAVSTVS